MRFQVDQHRSLAGEKNISKRVSGEQLSVSVFHKSTAVVVQVGAYSGT
jgi:hypothetical protein